MVHYRARRRPQGISFHEIMATGHLSWRRTRIMKDEIIMLYKKTVVADLSMFYRVWLEWIYNKPLPGRADRIRKRKTDNQQTVAVLLSSCSNLQYTANQNLLYRSFCSLFFSFFLPSSVLEIREANVGVRCYSTTTHTNIMFPQLKPGKDKPTNSTTGA